MRSNEERALRNEIGLQAHEKECSIRYGHINDTMIGMHRSVAGVRRDFRNVGVALITLLLTILGFLIKYVVFK